jgi:hypothetical protein
MLRVCTQNLDFALSARCFIVCVLVRQDRLFDAGAAGRSPKTARANRIGVGTASLVQTGAYWGF